MFSIIQPAPFWVQRSTCEKWACGLELSLQGLAGHRGQTRSGRTARGRRPLQVGAPQREEWSEQALSFSSSSIPPHQARTESLPVRPAGRPFPFRAAACLPFHLVLRCYGYKLQSFGQPLRESKFYSRERKREREKGRWGGGRRQKGKKAEIEKLLKGLPQPVRSINLG